MALLRRNIICISCYNNYFFFFLFVLSAAVVCLGSSSDSVDYLQPECLKVPTGEFASSVKSTIDVVQQVASLVSRYATAFGDFRLSNAIADCLDLLDLSAEELTRTLSASLNPKGTLLHPFFHFSFPFFPPFYSNSQEYNSTSSSSCSHSLPS